MFAMLQKQAEQTKKFWKAIDTIEPQGWNLPHANVYEDAFMVVKCFREGDTDSARFINPPMAGHHSNVAERVVRFYLENTEDSVYAIEWKAATDETKNYGIDAIVESLDVAINYAYEKTLHLVGLCQGGWADAIWAALNPQSLASLTIAGTPIDFVIDGGKCQMWLSMVSNSYIDRVIDRHDGLWPGKMQLTGFKMLNPVDRYVGTYTELQRHIQNDDEAAIKKWIRNNSWYETCQNLPGRMIREVIRQLFRGNELVRGDLEVWHQKVDLSRITCPVVTITGENDDITLEHQCSAIHDYVSSERQAHFHVPDCGHIGIFLKSESMKRWKLGLDFLNGDDTHAMDIGE